MLRGELSRHQIRRYREHEREEEEEDRDDEEEDKDEDDELEAHSDTSKRKHTNRVGTHTRRQLEVVAASDESTLETKALPGPGKLRKQKLQPTKRRQQKRRQSPHKQKIAQRNIVMKGKNCAAVLLSGHDETKDNEKQLDFELCLQIAKLSGSSVHELCYMQHVHEVALLLAVEFPLDNEGYALVSGIDGVTRNVLLA